MRSLDTQLHPERLKVITQQVEEEQAILQSQTLLRLQQIHAADRQTHSPQVGNARHFASRVCLVSQHPNRKTEQTADFFVCSNVLFLSFPPPGVGSPSPDPPPHGYRPSPHTNPALPSRHRGDHEPICPHQHHVHIQTEPGHHCAGRSPPHPRQCSAK